MSINSVLILFSVSLFALNQLRTFSKSWFKYNWRLSTQSPAYVRWVSSAYILGSHLDKQFGRSVIYNRNSSGPRIVSYGTRQVNGWLMEHICVRFSKYNLNHLDAFPHMPWWLNLDKRISWSTVSKAFFKSRKTTAFFHNQYHTPKCQWLQGGPEQLNE